MTAVPDEGYRFVRWSDRTVTEDLTVENVRRSATYTAIFEKISYLVTSDADAAGDVVILLAGAGGSVSANAAKVSYGDPLTITAAAESGYRFVSWSDGNTDATRTLTVTSPTKLTATFAKEEAPSATPSFTPSFTPSETPSAEPSVAPSTKPSETPSAEPSTNPGGGSSCGNSCGTITPGNPSDGNSSGVAVLALVTLAAAAFLFRKKSRG